MTCTDRYDYGFLVSDNYFSPARCLSQVGYPEVVVGVHLFGSGFFRFPSGLRGAWLPGSLPGPLRGPGFLPTQGLSLRRPRGGGVPDNVGRNCIN